MFDVYTLLANQIADIHIQLTAKIVSNPKNSPKWEVSEEFIDEKTTQLLVHELAPLLSLVNTLQRLANHHDHATEPPSSSFLAETDEK